MQHTLTSHIDSCHALVCHICRDEARQMFFAGYESYLLHAFPKVCSLSCAVRLAYAWGGQSLYRDTWVMLQDELRPISCSGHDSQGGMAMTLIDALDSLLVTYSADHPHLVYQCNNPIHTA